ncbi:MAG: N-acetylmuramoyl-L-alanine amidase [Candidatus Omnitrophica bacterium]|nr:N-acetylmuramoyl-L-alanine amidase [Candidatus Omnitrophota bacterium]
MKFKKLFSLFFLLIALSYLLSGCVSTPVRQALPTYTLNGATYVSLEGLCGLKGIRWDYDSFSRTIVLNKDSHRINLMVGETLVLVDERPMHLKDAVHIYQGAIVVPYKFKEQVIDVLFRDSSSRTTQTVSFSNIKKIVLDAGHGGEDPGAIGRTGLREKDVVLDIVKRLTKLLKAEGVEVVLTRSSDSFVPLARRVDIANRSGADLFVSIHANANRVRSLKGFEVYYVSPSAEDSKRALNAAKSAPLNIDSSCFADSSLVTKAILWDMIYTHSRAESIELGRSLCKSTGRNSDMRIIGVKGARFYVLKGARMPAVLVEVGFLSNATEEKMLKNNYSRQKIAENIAEGIGDYAQELVLTEAR